MKTVYVAGPMRNYPLFNFPAFDEAEARLRAAGWNVISPAAMDRTLGFDEHQGHLDGFDMDAAVRRDIDAILSLSPVNEDAVAMLPGWERSRGARAEKALAEWRGLAVIDSVTFEPISLPEAA
jgi:hypothetical protein